MQEPRCKPPSFEHKFRLAEISYFELTATAKDYDYDTERRTYVDAKTGEPVSKKHLFEAVDGKWESGAWDGDAPVGSRTLARGLLIRSMAREASEGGGDARAFADRLLDQLESIGSDPESQTRAIFYSRGLEGRGQRDVTPSKDIKDIFAARALNNALAGYFEDATWKTAYEPVELPDDLSGIREEVQVAFGRSIRAVAATADRFNVFNGVYLPTRPGEVYVNVRSDVGFMPKAILPRT
ncbi:MAG: hypothetical protein ACOZAQ_02180 [Pseudomonadota bacterium]